MTITIDATYEDGVLKPAQPLPLAEHAQVRITLEPSMSWTQRTKGIVKWNGDPEELARFAIDPAFDPQEGA
jgi:predicted DNA-binding antitoxin AbrB/MazE fold protein